MPESPWTRFIAELLGWGTKPDPPRSRAIGKIAGQLEVAAVPKASIFGVTFNSPDPQFAARVLNALVDAYLDHHLTIRQGNGRQQFFAVEASNRRKALREAEATL